MPKINKKGGLKMLQKLAKHEKIGQDMTERIKNGLKYERKC